MSFLGQALRGAERRSSLTAPSSALVEALGASGGYGGRAVSVQSSLQLIPVYSAIQLLSGAVGSLPLMVYRRLDEGRERATDHWMWRLLHDQPNPEMAADEVWALVTAHYYAWGNAFLAKVKYPGSVYPVDELWPIRPERVQVGVRDDGTRYFVLDGKTGEPLGTDDILHIRNFGTDGIVGLSPIQQARAALGTVADMQDFSGNFWASGAVSAVVATHPNKLSDQAKENVRSSIKRKLGAAGGADPFVLEEGMTIDTLTMPLGDAQFIEQRRLSLLDVALLFRVPPKMLGASTGDSLTYSTSEWESLDFVRWSLRSTLVRIESSLRRDTNLFLQGRRFYPEFLIDALLRGTSSERAAFYEKALDPAKGWLTRDEVRDLENLPPETAVQAPDEGEPVDGEPVLDEPPVPDGIPGMVPAQIPMSVNGVKGRAG